jgi:hypothetical protein
VGRSSQKVRKGRDCRTATRPPLSSSFPGPPLPRPSKGLPSLLLPRPSPGRRGPPLPRPSKGLPSLLLPRPSPGRRGPPLPRPSPGRRGPPLPRPSRPSRPSSPRAREANGKAAPEQGRGNARVGGARIPVDYDGEMMNLMEDPSAASGVPVLLPLSADPPAEPGGVRFQALPRAPAACRSRRTRRAAVKVVRGRGAPEDGVAVGRKFRPAPMDIRRAVFPCVLGFPCRSSRRDASRVTRFELSQRR